MNHQKIIDKFMTIKQVADTLGLKSRNSITRMVKKGELNFVTLAKGTSSETRLFFVAEVKKLKRERQKL